MADSDVEIVEANIKKPIDSLKKMPQIKIKVIWREKNAVDISEYDPLGHISDLKSLSTRFFSRVMGLKDLKLKLGDDEQREYHDSMVLNDLPINDRKGLRTVFIWNS